MSAASTAATGVLHVVALQPGETFHSVVRPFAGVCSKTGIPLTEVRLAWDDDRLGPWDLERKGRGGWTHQVTRHFDGSHCRDYKGRFVPSCMSQSHCPECHQYGTLVTVQDGWTDVTTCRHNERYPSRCTYRREHYRGD